MVCIWVVSCRQVFFTFLWERNGLGGCDGFGGVIGGKREEKGKKREDGKGEFK